MTTDEPREPKVSAWTEEEREHRTAVRSDALPPGTVPVTERWLHAFQVGELFPLRGWNCRIVGHFMDDDGKTPLGFAIVPESMTAAFRKKLAVDSKRRAIRRVK